MSEEANIVAGEVKPEELIVSVDENKADVAEKKAADIKAIQSMWTDAWRPPDRRNAWQWAEGKTGITKIPYSPVPGRFSTVSSPWVKEPLETLSDPTCNMVQIVAGIQASKTLLMEVGASFITHAAPGPTLWLDQTDSEAADELDGRLKELWKHSPDVAPLIPGSTGVNRYQNKRHSVRFLNGMPFWCLGAANIKNLQRRSIRYVFGDETWQWPAGRMREALARLKSFGWLGNAMFSSQAGYVDDDTDKNFRAGTQEQWEFACLNDKCGAVQPYLWENVEWSDEAKIAGEDGQPDTYDFDLVRNSARIVCPECGHEHDTSKTMILRQMNDERRGAGYRVMNHAAPSNHRSFTWNGMCSTPVGDLAVLYLQAKMAARRGDTTELEIFYQKRLALPWRDEYEDYSFDIEPSEYELAEEWDREGMLTRGRKLITRPQEPIEDDYGDKADYKEAKRVYERTVKNGKRLRVMAVDCQRDHFWVIIRAADKDGNSRLLFEGGGRDVDEPILTWEDLDKLQAQYEVDSRFVFVDAGHNTARVYEECGKRDWTATMGRGEGMFTHRSKLPNGQYRRVERIYAPVKKVSLGRGKTCRMHYFSNLNAKDILHRLRQNQDPSQGLTWEVPQGVSDTYLQQMDSEERVKKTSGKYQWEQIGARDNHLWDCEVLFVVFLAMMKMTGGDIATDAGEGGKTIEQPDPNA